MIKSFFGNFEDQILFFSKIGYFCEKNSGCQNFQISRRMLSNFMYNVNLKLEIGRGIEGAVKNLRNRQFWKSFGPSDSTILQFLGLCNFSFSKIFDYPPPPPASLVVTLIGYFWSYSIKVKL